jgi:hypothetical protein
MSDEADIANDYLQQMINTALTNAHNKATTPSNTTGKCIWCEESIGDSRRWCSVDCRNEYQKHYK